MKKREYEKPESEVFRIRLEKMLEETAHEVLTKEENLDEESADDEEGWATMW